MPSRLTPQHWIKNTTETWGLIAEFAVFILGVIGSFLLPPAGWVSAGGNKIVVRFSQFVVAVLVGLIFLLIQRWNRKPHVGRWALLAIAFLCFSVAAFFSYQHFVDTRTCEYLGGTAVIGTQFTQQAQSYLSDSPESTCTSLLNDFAGETGAIWTKDSINQSRYVLAGFYVLNLPLFTICMIAVIQALSCSQRRR